MKEEKTDINIRMAVGNASEAMRKMGEAMQRMQEAAGEARIDVPQPIGYLHCDYMQTKISVYEPVGWFKRLMLRWCFGLKYMEG